MASGAGGVGGWGVERWEATGRGEWEIALGQGCGVTLLAFGGG